MLSLPWETSTLLTALPGGKRYRYAPNSIARARGESDSGSLLARTTPFS
jgi:hypothetical protein